MIKKQKQFLGAVFILMLGLFINLATPLSASAEKGTESDPYVSRQMLLMHLSSSKMLTMNMLVLM